MNFRLLVACAMVASSVGTSQAQMVKRADKTDRTLVKLTTVDVRLDVGPDKVGWGKQWRDHAPAPLRFRWSSGYADIGSSVWQVSTDPDANNVIASGDAGKLAGAGKVGGFTIDFRSIVGSNGQRPLDYYVRVVTYKRKLVARETSGRSLRKRGARVAEAGKTSAPRTLKRLEQAGPPSQPVHVVLISDGSNTQFTEQGLHPELLFQMPIEVDLQTLKVRGKGGDEDPYLLVFVIYADGTTVKPELNIAQQQIGFTGSSVRIQSPSKTHENVPVGVDPGDNLTIPRSTGHFETSIRPIGVELAHQRGLGEADIRTLRERTIVGILVVGMEEDALPTTEVMDESRREAVAMLQAELDEIIRGVTVAGTNPTNIPDLVSSVTQIEGSLRERLIESTKARTLEQLEKYLAIHAFPTMILVPGVLNADDYIGHGIVTFSYEQILNAGTTGLPIEITLNQNYDGLPRFLQGDDPQSIFYKIEGRIRMK